MAKKAVKLIYDNLYTAYINGSDTEARQAMQKAAFYAGRAFTRGCVGYVHAIGHTVGGLYGVPHGRAMAILLPHVMKAYGEAVETRLAELADCCGMTAAETDPGSQNAAADPETTAARAGMFIRWIEEMNAKMGIPEGFDCIRQEDIPKMAEWADAEANPLYPVPKIMGRSELIKLINDIRI